MKQNSIDIDIIVAKIKDFPTLPTIYFKISEIIDNPRSTANDVAKVIMQDQAAASKVLKAANSPIYGFYGKIDNISQAISFIGFEEVKNLVIAMTIMDFFNTNFDNKNFNPVLFWQHSIAVGIMTRIIGKEVRASDLETYFLSGIMHDIGKLLFFITIPDEYIKVINYAIESKLTIREAEQQILGISHSVAGEILSDKWNLPPSIKYSTRYHITGIVENNYREIVACTHVANVAVSMYGCGYTDDAVLPKINRNVWDILKLRENFFTSVYQLMMQSYSESSNLLLK